MVDRNETCTLSAPYPDAHQDIRCTSGGAIGVGSEQAVPRYDRPKGGHISRRENAQSAIEPRARAEAAR